MAVAECPHAASGEARLGSPLVGFDPVLGGLPRAKSCLWSGVAIADNARLSLPRKGASNHLAHDARGHG